MSTIYKVAERAGVSVTTVSRYLNARIDLPAATAGRIDNAIEALEYRPNAMAKRLSLGRTEAVGLLAPDIANPFFAELAAAIEDEASRHGYSIFMTSTGGHRERELVALDRLQNGQVDGLIMMTNQPDDGRLAAALRQHASIVLIDEDVPAVDVPKLFVENFEGAQAATRHLIAHAHCDIAHIGGPAGLLSARERLAGFRDAMAEAGHAIPADHVHQREYSREFGYAATLAMLDGNTIPTAIFAGSDFIAIGVMQAAAERGLKVPRDLSLVGFDDMLFADFLAPALTTIRQPVDDLGRAGFRTLMALIEKKEPSSLTRLPVRLIERQSVALPPKRSRQKQRKGNL